jgi:two-component system, chemotaxis family, chemotaxis protein CheY
MGIRVLVVDDSGFMRKRIVEELRALGHSVVGEAKGGNEAVELYRTLRPDLVTMDITMRDKDGITAAKEILGEDPQAKIVFITILKDEKYKAEAEKLGAKAFLNKADTSQIAKALQEMERLQKDS